MKLDDLAVVIRPRNHWEAIDLGFGMARRWWRQLYLPWLCLILPLYGVLNLLFVGIPWLPPLVIWWLKPLYDRILLHVLSRAVFGQVPTTGETLRQIPNLLFTGLISHLTWLRFDFIRTFRLPVMQLEGLRGKARRERIRVLQQKVRSNAVWLIVVCVHVEVFLYIGLVTLLDFAIPSEFGVNLWDLFVEKDPGWEATAFNFLAVLPILLVEPAYAAGGFALYLNRRTELEGWDIELKFREMAARLTNAAGTVVLSLALLAPLALCLTPAIAVAEPLVSDTRLTGEDAAAVIKEVLADEIFGGVTTETVWRAKERKEAPAREAPDLDWLSSFAEGLAMLFEILLWAAGAAALYLFTKHAFRWYANHRPEHGREGPRPLATVAGMTIDPLALPSDIPAAVRALWRQERHREALSLLYRATLLGVVKQGLRQLPESATEGDVLRIARPLLDDGRFRFLLAVTDTWRDLAYAHKTPPGDKIERLCEIWPAAAGGRE